MKEKPVTSQILLGKRVLVTHADVFMGPVLALPPIFLDTNLG